MSEELVVRQCAPTLAGIKNGSLFSCPCDSPEELRQEVRSCFSEMHEYYRRGYTPKVKRRKACSSCSLKEICLPGLSKTESVKTYLSHILEEDQE